MYARPKARKSGGGTRLQQGRIRTRLWSRTRDCLSRKYQGSLPRGIIYQARISHAQKLVLLLRRSWFWVTHRAWWPMHRRRCRTENQLLRTRGMRWTQSALHAHIFGQDARLPKWEELGSHTTGHQGARWWEVLRMRFVTTD